MQPTPKGSFLNKNLSIPIFLAIQATLTALHHTKFNRNSYWPGIDVIAPMQFRQLAHDSSLSSDLFIESSSYLSGRGPFLALMTLLDSIVPGEAYIALSVVSSLTICLTSPILFLALYSSFNKPSQNIQFQLPFQVLLAWLIPVIGYPLWQRVPGIYVAGYGPFISAWATPEYFAILLASIAFLILNTTRKRNSVFVKSTVITLLAVSILIHPVSIFFLILIMITFKVFLSTFGFHEAKLITLSVGIGLVFLSFLIVLQSGGLNKYEFVQIYALLRHPHHFVPSYYVNKYSLVLFILLPLIIYIICRKDRPIVFLVLAIFIYSVLFNTIQFIATEIIINKTLTAFGPSRINTYILFSYYIILIFYHIRKQMSLNINKKNQLGNSQSQNLSKTIALLLIFSSLFLSAKNVSYDYVQFKSKVEKQLQELAIDPNESILVEPSSAYVTMGWREFGNVSVWFDNYFMFDMEGISEYRKRWLELCGVKLMGNCGFQLFTNRWFSEYMDLNKIDKLVLSFPLSSEQMGSNFSLAGNFEGLWSYQKMDTSRRN